MIMDAPVFSIIIPTLNSESLIKRSIESVLNQTFADFEILIMDGLSQDATLDIVENYHDQRIKISSTKDRGIYDAMNKGIAQARGEWVYFLGSDDRLFSQETLASVKTQCFDNIDVLYGNVFSMRFKGLYDGKFDEQKILKKNICHQAIFLRRSLFSKIGNFDLAYKAHADWDHNMRWLLTAGINHHYTDQVIAEYADGGFSSVSSDSLFKRERGLKYLLYSGYLLPVSKRIFLTLKEIKKSLAKGYFSLFFKIILHFPAILIRRSGINV